MHGDKDTPSHKRSACQPSLVLSAPFLVLNVTLHYVKRCATNRTNKIAVSPETRYTLMIFRYDGQNYKTTINANTIYEKDYFIQLPDRRYLRVEKWLEINPQQPKVMDEVHESEVDANDLVAIAQINR